LSPDTVLSKINQEKGDQGMMRSILNIMKRLGPSGLFLGMGARAVMVRSFVSIAC